MSMGTGVSRVQMISLFLSRFNFSLIHRPGQHSAKPDALSCQVDHQAEEEEETETK